MTRRAISRALAALGFLVAIVNSRGASAQQPSSPGSLSLSAAVEEALRKRPLLAADAQRIAAAQARVAQARAGLRPRLDIQASATDGPLGAPALGLGGLVGTPIKKHTGGSLNLVQTLLDFGRTHNTVRARRAEVSAGQEALLADQNRVALEVQQAFFQALQARRLVAVNRQILEQRQLVVRQADVLRQNGLATRLDVDLAQLNVSQAQLAIVRAQNEVETAHAALGSAVGRPVPSSTPLQDVILPTPGDTAPPSNSVGPFAPLDDATADALQNRPELRQSAAQVRVFEHLASAARAGKRPLLVGVGSVGKVNPVPLFEAGDKPWAVGLALTIPLLTGGLVEGQVEEARRNADAARSTAGELSNVIRQQVTAAVANLAAAEETIRVAQAQQVTAQDALTLATQRYQAQLGSIVELTQAQVAFATAQNDLVRARYDLELARAALSYATGRRPAAGAREGSSK
jgi:outer membrane protein